MKKQIAKLVSFGLIMSMISSVGSVYAAEPEIMVVSPENLLKDGKVVSLPGSFFQDENGSPMDQNALSQKDTETCTYVLNGDGSVSLFMTEEAFNKSKETTVESLTSYWQGLFDKENDSYREEYKDGLINDSESAFAIIVDKEIFEKTPYASFIANMTIKNLTLLSTYAQAYNGVPVEEQQVNVIFITDDGEILLTNMGEETLEEETEGNTSEESETETEKETFHEIRLEPAFVALDDENVRVEFTSVSEEVKNLDTDSEFIQYQVNFTVINKSDEYDIEVYVSRGNASVESFVVAFGNSNNNTMAGKTNDTANFVATKYTDSSRAGSNTDGVEHIERLEDLLQFEAKLSLRQYSSDGKQNTNHNRYETTVSLAHAAEVQSDTEEGEVSPAAEVSSTDASYSEEEIKAQIQGTWKKINSDTTARMIFDESSYKIMDGEITAFEGEYIIDTDKQEVVLVMQTADGPAGAHFSFTMDGGMLAIHDKSGTYEKIESPSAANYTDPNTVKKVQEALNTAGYDCGTPDGSKGPHTTAMIQAYQTDNDLDATGEIDDALLNSMGLQ